MAMTMRTLLAATLLLALHAHAMHQGAAASGTAHRLGGPAPAGARALYKDPALPIPSRARDLLARMTLAEKVGQLLQPLGFDANGALLSTPQQIIEQYNSTGLGAWYMTSTALPPPTRHALGWICFVQKKIRRTENAATFNKS